MNHQNIVQAIYIINRAAKMSRRSKTLYTLKRSALLKLLRENSAYVVGLHYYSSQRCSTPRYYLLICSHNYFFHLVPKHNDLSTHPTVTAIKYHRNPLVTMPLDNAIKIVSTYINKQTN
jgi:hypothetical protein